MRFRASVPKATHPPVRRCSPSALSSQSVYATLFQPWTAPHPPYQHSRCMLHCFSPGQLPTRPIITVGVCYTVSALDSSPPLLSTQSAFASRCQHWKTPLATPLRVLQHWQSNVCWRGGRSHVDDHMDITRLEEVEEEEEEEGGRG